MTTRETTHTPGPWCIKRVRDFMMPTWLVQDADGRTVADCSNGYADTMPEEANARLIAAAPALLAALEGMNHLGGAARGGYCICAARDGSAPDARHSTSCADARAAIRQAREVTT